MSQPLLDALSRLASWRRRFTEKSHSVGQASNDWIQLDIMVGAASPFMFLRAINHDHDPQHGRYAGQNLSHGCRTRLITAYPPNDNIISGNYR